MRLHGPDGVSLPVAPSGPIKEELRPVENDRFNPLHPKSARVKECWIRTRRILAILAVREEKGRFRGLGLVGESRFEPVEEAPNLFQLGMGLCLAKDLQQPRLRLFVALQVVAAAAVALPGVTQRHSVVS